MIYFFAGNSPYDETHTRKEFCGIYEADDAIKPEDVLLEIVEMKKEELKIESVVLTAFNTLAT